MFVNNKGMKKCIFILTICLLSVSGAWADDFYYDNFNNSGMGDVYTKTNNNTWQSMNTGITYKAENNTIYGSDASYYIKSGNMIYDMSDNTTYIDNGGYIQKF